MSSSHILLKSTLVSLAACLWCSSATAQTPGQLDTPERISVLVTYGEDECPEAAPDEIVVCAQQPESERYRIPKELRQIEKNEPGEQSWTSVVASHDDAARVGRPSSCSVVGTFGFSGCQAAFMRQWFDERRTIDP
ncbi:hypothetical protein A8B75_12665 [Sphingomonadales bacterium EhC05]|jgi:hypothetical protein|nr:hypothetical protein A8B75_12665 [Sphingomonadales bacterium EhC05]